MRLHEAGEITVNEQQASNTLGMRFSDLLEVPASAAFWNDLLTYRDVVKAFDLAIEIAEGDHVGS